MEERGAGKILHLLVLGDLLACPFQTCPNIIQIDKHVIISWCLSQVLDTCCRTFGTDDAIKELTCYNIHSTG